MPDKRNPPASKRRSVAATLAALESFTQETERSLEVVRRREGLAHNDVHALNALVAAQEDGIILTPGDLHRTLVLSPAAVTALLDRLEDQDLIKRSPGVEDARTVAVEPTERAHGVVERVFQGLAEQLATALDGSSGPELDAVTQLLTSLAEAAIDARLKVDDSTAPRRAGS